MKILIAVEDQADMRELIRIRLSPDERLEVVGEAATLAEALRLIRESEADLVILDHYISGDIMGIQAAPLLKAASPQTKILLFTAHHLEVEASREPAIDAYLSKAQFRDLLRTVLELVEPRRDGAP